VTKGEAEYVALPPRSIYRDFLDPAMHARLLAWAIENEAQFETSLVGGEADAKHDPSRRISLCASDFGPMMAVFRQRVLDFVPRLIADLRVTPFEPCGVELDLVANNDGAFFKRHIDTFLRDARNASDRVLSVVYYFHAEPKAFSGGTLRLYSLGTTENGSAFADVEPEQNVLLVFPSWVPHEVLPVSCPSRRFSDSRFNVNCWVHRRSKKQFSAGQSSSAARIRSVKHYIPG
jgi:Rps23 Pro-64 3,4-dihydroxylase Tpa1-like proline 4-hydroxylase